jgi:phosphonate transport system ATP-binding protein
VIGARSARAASAAISPAAGAGVPLRVQGVEKSFGNGEPVLKGVDLEVHGGELVAVLGANGSGKSTLLRCVVRLLDADRGSIELAGRELSALDGRALRQARREAAVVFQQVALVRRRTALDNVLLGALGRLGLRRSLSMRLVPADVRADAYRALQRVGLLHKADQRADQLSGGQAQRVAIARALCQQAAVILADEPVASLDPRAAEEVLALLADVAHGEGLGVLCVLHQPDLARRYADRLVGLYRGRVTFDAAPVDVAESAIHALYRDEDDAA